MKGTLRRSKSLAERMAVVWLSVVGVTALMAWTADRLRWFLEVVGVGVLGLSLAVALGMVSAGDDWVPHRRQAASGSDPSRAAGPGAGRWVGLAPCWLTDSGSSVLGRFLDEFEECLTALRWRLMFVLGDDVGQALSLHEQIEFAGSLGIWSADDLKGWRESLRVRCDILAYGGVGEAVSRLQRRTTWLHDLTCRTVQPQASSFPQQRLCADEGRPL